MIKNAKTKIEKDKYIEEVNNLNRFLRNKNQ
jgi:hypothetical protein